MSVEVHIGLGEASAALFFEHPFGPRTGSSGDADVLARVDDAIENAPLAVLGYDPSGRGWSVGEVLAEYWPWVAALIRQEIPEARVRVTSAEPFATRFDPDVLY